MPASLVTAVSAPICAGLVAVTVTPGRTPPCASLISPLMLPVELAPPPCANATDESANTMAIAQLMFFQPVICVNLRAVARASVVPGVRPPFIPWIGPFVPEYRLNRPAARATASIERRRIQLSESLAEKGDDF